MPKRSTPGQPSLFGGKPSAAKQKISRPSTFREAITSRRSSGPKSSKPNSANVGEKRIWLSATAIESMNRCPRCFWIERQAGIRQPEGIVSRLANRFDIVIKKYFDLYRAGGDLPPLIQGQVEGRLQYPFQEKYWYRVPDAIGGGKYGFYGKLDECLVRADGKYTPVDHKTASSDPNTKELIPAYQFQLNAYAFLLEQNGHPTTGIGHLVYFFPAHGEKLHAGFPMQITVKTLKTDPSAVLPRLKAAIELLEGPLPEKNPACNFCEYVEKVKKF